MSKSFVVSANWTDMKNEAAASVLAKEYIFGHSESSEQWEEDLIEASFDEPHMKQLESQLAMDQFGEGSFKDMPKSYKFPYMA